MLTTSLYVNSKQSQPAGGLEVSNHIAKLTDRGSVGSDLKTQSNPRNRPVNITHSKLGPVKQNSPIKLKESDVDRDRSPLAPKDLNVTVASTFNKHPSDRAQKDARASEFPFEARGSRLPPRNLSLVTPFTSKATDDPDSELIRTVFSLVSYVNGPPPPDLE